MTPENAKNIMVFLDRVAVTGLQEHQAFNQAVAELQGVIQAHDAANQGQEPPEQNEEVYSD